MKVQIVAIIDTDEWNTIKECAIEFDTALNSPDDMETIESIDEAIERAGG